MSTDFNIKSTTIEKGLDLAKDFLGKLISPSIDQVGQLLAEPIKYYRFKNQVNTLLKAKAYIASKQISTKAIQLKVLVPLLEHISLEEDENFQDLWARLLANMVDSEQNFQNHVFPYILGQLSLNEFAALRQLRGDEYNHDRERELLSSDLEGYSSIEFAPKMAKTLSERLEKTEQEGFVLRLEAAEIANLERLNVIRRLPPKIWIEDFSTEPHDDGSYRYVQPNASYNMEEYGHRLTDLGSLFVSAVED